MSPLTFVIVEMRQFTSDLLYRRDYNRQIPSQYSQTPQLDQPFSLAGTLQRPGIFPLANNVNKSLYRSFFVSKNNYQSQTG
jgi:hypothetical protein